MRNTEIIYSALVESGMELPELELEEVNTRCMVCGKKITQGVKRNKVVSSNFTDYDACAVRESIYVCKECATCIKTRELRTHNILADKDNLFLFKKNDLEEYLFNLYKYVKGEFIIGITRSFKKHNSFRCAVNYDPRASKADEVLEALSVKPSDKVRN